MIPQPNVKVNIIGRGKGWENAPCDELAWGITLINLKRKVDLVIDMNVYEDGRWGELEKQGAIKSRQLAIENNVPYINLGSYPINEIIEYFETDYFSNTIDYAIALAIYKGFTEINLYGVNMTARSEYLWQKPSLEFWIGQALGRGIKVKVHGSGSLILRTNGGVMYGYGTPQKGLL
ncbi:MAG: hypothetical protein WC332_00925 [Clostridia bacterium]